MSDLKVVREEVVEHLFTHVTRFLLCLSLSLAQLAKSQLLHSQYSEGILGGLKKLAWHSVRFYFFGHFDLSQPELVRECIVCLVVSGMTTELRRSLWSVFETPLPLLPLLNLGLRSWITQWCDLHRKPSKLWSVIREVPGACFLLELNMYLSAKLRLAQKLGKFRCYWALSSCC